MNVNHSFKIMKYMMFNLWITVPIEDALAQPITW